MKENDVTDMASRPEHPTYFADDRQVEDICSSYLSMSEHII